MTEQDTERVGTVQFTKTFASLSIDRADDVVDVALDMLVGAYPDVVVAAGDEVTFLASNGSVTYRVEAWTGTALRCRKVAQALPPRRRADVGTCDGPGVPVSPATGGNDAPGSAGTDDAYERMDPMGRRAGSFQPMPDPYAKGRTFRDIIGEDEAADVKPDPLRLEAARLAVQALGADRELDLLRTAIEVYGFLAGDAALRHFTDTFPAEEEREVVVAFLRRMADREPPAQKYALVAAAEAIRSGEHRG